MNVLRPLIRLLFSMAGLVLLLVFLVRVFAPGTPETAVIFQKLQLVQPALNRVVGFLILPITLAWNWMTHQWPNLRIFWFPVVSAERVAHGVVVLILKIPHLADSPPGHALRNANLGMLFPGVVDWRLLLALPLWGKVEAILLKLVIHAEAFQYRQYVRKRDAAMMASFHEASELQEPARAGAEGKDLLFRHMVKGLQSEISNLQGIVHLDPLTQLFNRGYFNQRLTEEMNRAKQEGKHLALMMIDIDNFKHLNDQYGHTIGDLALMQVAKAVSGSRPRQGNAMACRYGGEEIAVILTDTSITAAEQLAETLCRGIAAISLTEEPKAVITVSIGVYTVCFVPTNGSHELTEEAFVAKADSQMYIAKRSGKNRVVSASLP